MQAVEVAQPLTEQEYRDLPGLSNSSMKHLAVSPFRFWHMVINPNRPAPRETPEMTFGSALHCAVLEPDKFDARYACELDADGIPGLLVTVEDIRTWLRNRCVTPKGTKKADLIQQVQAVDETALILEAMESQHATLHAGKVMLPKEDWTRLAGCVESLRSEPRLNKILEQGAAEVPMFATDEETGVRLKARMDWVRPELILDLKSFVCKRGKGIDRSVADALLYEGYLKQAVFYSMVRGWPKAWNGEVVVAFAESEPPHEVRLKAIRPKTAGQPNLYWTSSLLEIRGLIRLYASCLDRFGENPWREPRDIEALQDEEMPGMAFL